MKRNLLSVDIFIGAPGGRSDCVLKAFTGIMDANHYTVDKFGVSFIARHWTLLPAQTIKTEAQEIIDEVLRKCDIGIFIFEDNLGSIKKDEDISYTEHEFLLFKEQVGKDSNNRRLITLVKEIDLSKFDISMRNKYEKRNNLLKENALYYVYNNDDIISEKIKSSLLSIALEIIEKNSFLKMPIFHNAENTDRKKSEITSEIYKNQNKIKIYGEEIPYSFFFESDILIYGELENQLIDCKISDNLFEVKTSNNYRLRHKLFQSQILLNLIESEKLRSNDYIVRLSIERGKLKAQRTTYDQQAISNIALFWPPFDDESITGQSGLLQEFGSIKKLKTQESEKLNNVFTNLYNLINKEENLDLNLPTTNTPYLANTLGISNLIYLEVGDVKTFLVKRKPADNIVYSGLNTFASSFALRWGGELKRSRTKKIIINFWEYIKNELKSEIKKNISDERKKIIGDSDENRRIIDKIELTDIKPINILREIQRGGKPQLFIISKIEQNDDVYELIKSTFLCYSIDKLEKLLSKRDGSQEFFAGVRLILEMEKK